MENQISSENYFKRTAKKFVQVETASGFLLIICTAIALILANSSLKEAYHHLLETKISFGVSGQQISKSLHFWINDGLMVIFFLVIGLEIKREGWIGKLSSPRKAALPFFAAMGGMVIPALIYVAINLGGDTMDGWGIPMATDIAFSLGILSLLRNRVPDVLRIFLAALAVVDDIGAIFVIAIFYSKGISFIHLYLSGGLFLLLWLINFMDVRNSAVYLIIGLGLWFTMLKSGIHPTIAGVLLASTIPLNPKKGHENLQDKARHHLDRLREKSDSESSHPGEKHIQKEIQGIRKATKGVYPPLLRMENSLTPINSFFIMPVFALANAGVEFESGWMSGLLSPLSLGIIAGLVAGKVVGVSLFTFLGRKFNMGTFTGGVTSKGITGIGLMAGIGFTMSIFIANLAFSDEATLAEAKIAILAASLISGLGGLLWLRFTHSKK